LDTQKLKRFAGSAIDALFMLDSSSPRTGKPSWKFRRKLIFGAYRLAFAMIAFGAITFMWDTSVSSSLITGGVALMSIIIGAYVAGASYEDAKHGNKDEILEP
jgi:fructose-1,6-bisphosphatase/inositol monophosphatase family enzyme